MKGSKALTRSDPSLDGSMVLFNHIVEVPHGSASAASAEFAGPPQFGNDLGIRRVAVDVDHSRSRMARRPQCVLEEALGRSRVTCGALEKVDGCASGIHGPV